MASVILDRAQRLEAVLVSGQDPDTSVYRLVVAASGGAPAGSGGTVASATNSTVTVAGTSYTVFAAAALINGGWITNPSGAPGTLYVNAKGGTAVTTASGDTFGLAPGQTFTFPPLTNAVTATSATAAHAFSAASF